METLNFSEVAKFVSYFNNWRSRGLILARQSRTSEQAKEKIDATGVELIGELRKNHSSSLLEMKILPEHLADIPFVENLLGKNPLLSNRRMVLVLDLDIANQILTMAETPDGPIRQSPLNIELFDSFQPKSLIISDGVEGKERRAFNECVLNTPSTEPTRHDPTRPVHEEFQSAFLRKIAETANEYLSLADGGLSWEHFEEFAKIATFRVVLGDNSEEDAMIGFMGRLEEIIMKTQRYGGVTSDWNLILKWKVHKFRENLNNILDDRRTESLAARIDSCTSKDDLVDPVSEVGHWLFALKDALDTHLPRTLALILAHPDVYARVREEIGDKDLDDADHINQLSLLDGCVHETLRLWTPVQLILRETSTEPVTLGDGTSLPPDSHIVIHAAFINRNIHNADAFDPDRWNVEKRLPLLHFNWGPRRCAGSHIALFAIKAAVARVLVGKTLTLKSPKIDPHSKIPQLYDHFALEIDVLPS